MACYRREWTVLGRRVKYERRTGDEPLGRFGGGWDWSLGVQMGSSTVILNCLTFMLRIDKRRTR